MGSFGFGKRRHFRSALAFYQSRDLRGPLGRILGSRCGRLTRWFLRSAGKKHWMLKPRMDTLPLKCLELKVRTPSRLLKSKLRGRGLCASREETEGVLGRGFLQILHVTVHQDADEEVGRRQWGRRRDDRHTPRRRNNSTLAGGRHSTRGISSSATWRYAGGRHTGRKVPTLRLGDPEVPGLAPFVLLPGMLAELQRRSAPSSESVWPAPETGCCVVV